MCKDGLRALDRRSAELRRWQTYDKTGISALVATLSMLFDMQPMLRVVMSSAVRNGETFEVFRNACCECAFAAIDWPRGY